VKKLFYDEAGRLNIKRPFLLGNLGLFVIVAVLWISPGVSSWQSAVRLISQQRQIYTAYAIRTQVANDIYEVMPLIYPLPNAEIIAALADMKDLAYIHGLRTVNFSTVDIHSHGAEGLEFVDVRGTASFTGHTDNITAFIYEAAVSQVFIRAVHIDFTEDGAALLQLEFSLFGIAP